MWENKILLIWIESRFTRLFFVPIPQASSRREEKRYDDKNTSPSLRGGDKGEGLNENSLQ